jgi:hypothetical protein
MLFRPDKNDPNYSALLVMRERINDEIIETIDSGMKRILSTPEISEREGKIAAYENVLKMIDQQMFSNDD